MNPISPKVTHGAVAAGIATLLLQVLNDSTPETLAVFGKYEPLAAGLVPILAFAITAYLKSDPLRVVPSAAPAAPTQDSAVVAKVIGAVDANEARELAQNLAVKAVAILPEPPAQPPAVAAPAEVPQVPAA